MRRDETPGLPVTVLYEGNERALALGAELAQMQGRALEIAAVDAELVAAAKAWLSDRDLSARVEQISVETAEQLSAQLASQPAGIVVLERAGRLGSAVDTDRILAGPPSSVILVG